MLLLNRKCNIRFNIFNFVFIRKLYLTKFVGSRPVWGIKKKHKKVKLHFDLSIMADAKVEEALAPLRASVKEQGDFVRQLKTDNAPEFDIKKAVSDLKARKKVLEEKELEMAPESSFVNRAKMEDLLKRRFFYDQSFAIYGGITGQYDFGPMGCALKTNIINTWRSFFILEEQMLEVDCSVLTPEPVLKASGHVERFADLMVKDLETGECFRLDHLIKTHLEALITKKETSNETRNECQDIISKLDGLTKDEMQDIIYKYNIRSPLTKNPLSEPMDFNLMFATQIGPTNLVKGFLRPETAQGIFVNFKRLLEFNHGKLPFAAAQIGNSFRNEISPRSGLLRVREFTMAEIEHFCDPKDKSHPKFSTIVNCSVALYSACNQMDGKPVEVFTIGEAVKKGLIANETLGYFMARIHTFLVYIGINKDRLRFRQHMSNEMAHYACDCWDAECLTSYGWIECVGCADRSAYDLTQHSKATGTKLTAEKKLPEPIFIDVIEAVPNKSMISKEFKQDCKFVFDILRELDITEICNMENHLKDSGEYLLNGLDDKQYKILSNMVAIKTKKKTIYVEEITPNVVEPSFGIGRIMYCLLEHNFQIRPDDEQRTFLSIPAVVAPVKCAVFPLGNNEVFNPLVKQVAGELLKYRISHKIDDSSGSIGRRYTRMDEIAVPFGITIDFDSLSKPHTVTLRERDSTKQIRIPVDKMAEIVNELSNGELVWKTASDIYPKFQQQETTKV